jgi:hypothetical protein
VNRQLIAYLLIALLVAVAAAFVGFRLYHSRKRTIARQQKRTRADYDRRFADREDQRSG